MTTGLYLASSLHPPHPPNLAPTQNRAWFTAGLNTDVRTLRPHEHRQVKMGWHADPYMHTEGRPLPSQPVHLAKDTEADPTLCNSPSQGLKGQPGTGLLGPLRSPSSKGQQAPAATLPSNQPLAYVLMLPPVGWAWGWGRYPGRTQRAKVTLTGREADDAVVRHRWGMGQLSDSRAEESSSQYGSQGQLGRGHGAGQAVGMAQTHPTLWPP